MRKSLSAVAMVVGALMLMASALTATAGPASAEHNGEDCEATYKEVVDKPAYTETVEHDAEYKYIEHPAVDPVIEPGVWANWAPSDTQGPQDYRPVWPEDDRGKWIVHDQGVPPGHEGPDGVYQKGGGNSPYFYRQAEKVITEGKEAWTEKKLVKEAWTETIEHEATYKTVVDKPGHCEPDNPDTVCATEPELCEPTDEVPDIDIGTPDSVERPPAAQSPPVVVSPPTEQTAAPTQPVSTAGPATPDPVKAGELAYSGPSGMLIGTAMVGLGLLFSGLALRRRFAQNI